MLVGDKWTDKQTLNLLTISNESDTPVGNLKDGYVRNAPLPRVPQIQSAKRIAPSAKQIAPKTGIPLPGYSHVPSWIPTLPKLGSILGFSQRLL